jgi:putative endonuclease
MWYVYFFALSDGDTYVGSTNDLNRRFKSHALGQVSSTQPFRPVKLKCYVGVETELNARRLER